MKEHLTKLAAEWFDDRDAWNSFMDLIDLNLAIQDHWLDEGSKALRKHFRDNPTSSWSFTAWDGYIRDTWWFLEEFGEDSIGIGYGWRYHLCFGVKSARRIKPATLAAALGRDDYRSLVVTFGRNDPNWFEFPLHQYGDFSFGVENDGNVTGHELAWFSGHRTNQFVEQAAAKIDAFVKDPDITALMQKLNRELLAQ